MDEVLEAIAEVIGEILGQGLAMLGMNISGANWAKVLMILGMIACVIILVVMICKY